MRPSSAKGELVERNKRRLHGSTAEIPKRNRGNVGALQAHGVLRRGAGIRVRCRIFFSYLLAKSPESSFFQPQISLSLRRIFTSRG